MQDERRDFFRIDDSLRLSYREVASGDLPELVKKMQGGEASQFAVMSSLSSISQQMIGHMHRIEAEEPDIARFLKALDQKIDILGRAIQAQASNIADQPIRMVNLSASGLSFESDDRFEAGAMLELKILLMPSFTGLLLFSEVIGSDDNPGGDFPYLVRVKFTHIQESDRDILIQHAIHRQSKDLKARREAREDS